MIVAAEMLTGRAGRRRVSLAGIQRAHLRAHHPVHSDHRVGGLRPRSVDGCWSNAVSGRPERMAFLELNNVSKAFGATSSRRACARYINLDNREGRVRRDRRLFGRGQDDAHLDSSPGCSQPDSGHASRWMGAELTEPGPDRGVVFQNYSLLPWLTVFENVFLAVDQVFSEWTVEREARAHRALHRHGEPHAPRATSGRASSRAACANASRWRGPSRWSPQILLHGRAARRARCAHARAPCRTSSRGSGKRATRPW